MKDKPVFVIDASVLKHMIEGNNENKSKEMLDLITKIKKKGGDIKTVSTASSLLYAIYTANPETKLKDVQKTMKILKVMAMSPFVEFKTEKDAIESVVKLASKASK